MQAEVLEGGFANPPLDAARAFRAVMQAIARPGTIHKLAGAVPPAPLSEAAATILLTLCDAETPVHLADAADCPEVRAWLAFHTGAPVSGRDSCMFAVGPWNALIPLSGFPIGTAEYPDRSATLIVESEALQQSGATLTGPGIQSTNRLSLPDIDAFQANHALFPLGLDFLFTCGNRIAALPRSTCVHTGAGPHAEKEAR